MFDGIWLRFNAVPTGIMFQLLWNYFSALLAGGENEMSGGTYGLNQEAEGEVEP